MADREGTGRVFWRTAGARTLLASPAFRRLWLAQFITVTVLYGMALAGAVLVEERTHSSAQTSLVILSAILPAVLGSLVAGAVVDRFGRVPILLISHAARAVLALAFWASTRSLPPVWTLIAIYSVNIVSSVFSQFAMTAELALLPDLVEPQQLISANGMFQLNMLVGQALGIVAITPIIIKSVGAPAVGLVGMVLNLVVLPLVARLPRSARGSLSASYSSPPQPAPDQPRWAAIGADLGEGWRVMARDRILRLVAIQATVAATLLLVLLSLVPGLAARYLRIGVEDTPLVVLPGGLAFVVGAVLVGRLQSRFSRPAWIAIGLLGLGASIGAMALVTASLPSLWLFMLLVLGVGFSLSLIILPARTVIQERPPAKSRGRVIAAQLALANAASVVPLVLGGVLADQLGIQPVMGVLSLVAFGAGAAGLRYLQS